MPPNENVHLSFEILKKMHQNPTTPTANQKHKWENISLMDGYCVVEVIAIPYPSFGVIINIISKEDTSNCVTIEDFSQCTCLDCIKMYSHSLGGKEGHWAIAYTSTMCLDFYVTVEHDKNKFIHAPIRFYDLHQLYLIIKFT